MSGSKERICIVGQGYVGLTLTAVVSQSGFEVVGVEKDEERLEALRKGRTHFDEPGLEATIRTQMNLGSLSFERKLETDTSEECTTYIFAVGSPLDGDREPDLSILRSAVSSVADVIDPGDTVIIRTTISVGTAREMGTRIEKETGMSPGADFHLAQAPERTIQGAALEEIQSLPQVIGGYDEESTDRAEQIFSDISGSILKVESMEAAELIKLFDNTYRDIAIAIGNAFGEVAAAHGLNGQRLIEVANAGYKRNQIMNPGAGVGGGCLPKDPYLLLDSIEPGSDVVDLADDLITKAREINEAMPRITCDLIDSAVNETGRRDSRTTSIVLGAAFKGRPATNDTRNTPAKPIISHLRGYGPVHAYDPHVEAHKIVDLGAVPEDANCLEDLFEREQYDMIVVANDNPTFRNLTLSAAREEMSNEPVLIDGWGIFDPVTAKRLGFKYKLVGGETTMSDGECS